MLKTTTHGSDGRDRGRHPRSMTDRDRRVPPHVAAVPSSEDENEALVAIRAFNESHKAHADLWSRARHAADVVRRARSDATAADAQAAEANLAHRIIQAEHHDRRAPRPRQLALAAVTVALDGVACDFAAQALGGGRTETLAWTALFLAVLAAGELALDVYQERQRPVTWRVLAVSLGCFIVMLGLLRYTFLLTAGPPGQAAAIIGAALFTAATACFVILGYRALRAAEMPACWRARRGRLAAERSARTAHANAATLAARRDRLADAYLSEIRASLLRSATANQLPAMEQAIRDHLTGGA